MKIIVTIFVLIFATNAFSSVLSVTYPHIEERSKQSYGYKILKLALEKSGEKYILTINPDSMNQVRARRSLENPDGDISVIDLGTSKKFEEKYKAIYFPIDFGLSGYRLFIINKHDKGLFSKIDSISDLSSLLAGQGIGWADIKILEYAGLNVDSIADFTSILKMVFFRRIDYFPLGIEEIDQVIDEYGLQWQDLVIEEKIALKYPFARLFFVNKNNQHLHDVIYKGLKNAYNDGSLQKLFFQELDIISIQKKLENRIILELENPNLTEKFKKIPKEYFWKPEK